MSNAKTIRYAEGMTRFQRYALFCYKQMTVGQLLDALTARPDAQTLAWRGLDEEEWRGGLVEALRQKFEDLKGASNDKN